VSASASSSTISPSPSGLPVASPELSTPSKG
jgi:hypothetical protein